MAKVAQYLILNSPPGQASLVQSEIVSLLGGKVSEGVSSTFSTARRTYDLTQGTIYSTQNSSTLLVCCTEGSPSPGIIVSSAGNGEVFSVNHEVGTLVPHENNPSEILLRLFPSVCEATLEPYRHSLHEIFSKHASSCYCPHKVGAAQGRGGCEVFYEFDQEGNVIGFVVILSALVTNLRNYWAGQMKSRWCIQFPGKEKGSLVTSGLGTDGAAILLGKVAIRSHYCENGNVQMFQSRELKAGGTGKLAPVSIDLNKCSTPELFAAAVQKNVASIESSVLSGLDDAYDGFSANALKEVRRILPVSGTKFNWAQVGAQKVMKAALTKK